MKTFARALEAYMACVGTVLSVAMLASMNPWMDALAGGFGTLGFFLLYKLMRGLEVRRAQN
jgi:hypothetical protein